MNTKTVLLAILAIVAASAVVAVPSLAIQASAWHSEFDSARECHQHFPDMGFAKRSVGFICVFGVSHANR